MTLLALALYFVLFLVLDAVVVVVVDRLVAWTCGYPPIFRLCTRFRRPGRFTKDGVTVYNFGWLRVVPWRYKR